MTNKHVIRENRPLPQSFVSICQDTRPPANKEFPYSIHDLMAKYSLKYEELKEIEREFPELIKLNKNGAVVRVKREIFSICKELYRHRLNNCWKN